MSARFHFLRLRTPGLRTLGLKSRTRNGIGLVVLVTFLFASVFLCSCEKKEEGPVAAAEPNPKTTETAMKPDQDDAGQSYDRHIVNLNATAEQAAGIAFGEAEVRNLDACVNVTGEVLANANTQTLVTTPVTGRVIKILVSVGDHIPEGKPLLMVRSTDIEQAECDMLQAQQQVRADLKQALVQIDCDTATAQEQVKLSQKQYARMKQLYDERIASQSDYQTAETTFQKDKINVDSLAKKRVATISLAEEKMRLVTGPAKTKLRLLGVSESDIEEVLKTQDVQPEVPVPAPEDGIVVERLVNVGELVDPSKKLFTIGDFHTVWLKADVFEKDIPKVKIGEPIELRTNSFPDRIFSGKLNYVASLIDPDTRTLQVRAEVANPQDLLKPKMFGTMKIKVGQQKVLSIPISAVQDTRSDKVVYVPTSQTNFEERHIKLGGESGDYVEVKGGLNRGERVVTNGSFDLRAAAVRTYGG